MHGLTDETYALLAGIKPESGQDREGLYFTITLLNHMYWIAGGCAGALAGTLIPFDMKGLEFVLASLFAVLVVEKFFEVRRIFPFAAGAVSCVAAVFLFGKDHLLLGGIIMSVVILAVDGAVRDDEC